MKWRSKRRAAVVGAVVASTLATSSPAGAGPKMHAFNWGGNPAFGYGGVGNVVGFWQRILYASSNIWGDSNPCLGADGYYGNSTFWGTAAFQQKLGVPVDGVTGSRTLSAAFTYRRPDGIQALQWGGSTTIRITPGTPIVLVWHTQAQPKDGNGRASPDPSTTPTTRFGPLPCRLAAVGDST